MGDNRMDGNAALKIIAVISLMLGIFLVTQRWFWIFVIGLSAIACVFSMIASIIHFQILGAVGFFVLTVILASITSFIANG